MRSLGQDLRFAFRSFRKTPGFTATVVAVIALGVGVGTAIFSVVNAMILQPLPYAEPDRVVVLWKVNQQDGIDVEHQRRVSDSLSPGEFLDWRDKSGLFESAAAFFTNSLNIDDDPVQHYGHIVTSGLFETLGVDPFLGRGFLPEECRPNAQPVIVLQHDFWRKHFGSDPKVVGRTYRFGGTPHIIIGVMPPDFVYFLRQVNWFTPYRWPLREVRRPTGNFKAIARLKEGITLEQAQSRADVFSRNLAAEYAELGEGGRLVLSPIAEEASGEVRPALLLLFAASGLVLLVTCSNVANLLLIRSLARSREMAIRAAVGAGRGRLIRQLLTESLLLSLAGGAIGVDLALFLVADLQRLLPDRTTWAKYLVQAETIRIDPWVIGFAVAVSLATGILFGLIPAFRGTAVSPAHWLKEGGPGSVGPRSRRTNHVLTLTQVALAVVLTTGAGLLVKSFWKLYQQGPGFRPQGLAAMRVIASRSYIFGPDEGKGLSREERDRMYFPGAKSFWTGLQEGLLSLPGVTAATRTYQIPMRGHYAHRDFRLEHRSETEKTPARAAFSAVAPNYFEVLGIPLVAGRYFTSRDGRDSPPIAIVNREAARRFWPGEDPVGKRLRHASEWADKGWQTVVGVVGDVRDDGMDKGAPPAVYEPDEQSMSSLGFVVVRTTREPDSLFTEMVRKLRETDPQGTVLETYRMDHLVRDSSWRLHYSMLLLVGLAGLALAVAATGVYGLLSFSVGQRTREIGLRVALGASKSQVVGMVLRQGLVLVGTGIVLGLAAAAALTRFLQSLLFGVQPIDAPTFALVALVLVGAACLASYLPVRRAAKVEPMDALRYE